MSATTPGVATRPALAFVVAGAIVMGDKADQNTKEKTIRFTLPW